jgi:hypothetical protein
MTKKGRDYNKSGWGTGPWNNEPDRKDFTHEGYACFLLRNNVGVWCGYVGVPSSHPLYGVTHNDVDVEVHGGLTYSNKCDGHVCHDPEPDMPDDVWWFGFDTAHYRDYIPGNSFFRDSDQIYRDITYVEEEIRSLASQLKKMDV